MKTHFLTFLLLFSFLYAQAQFSRPEELPEEMRKAVQLTSSVLDKNAEESVSHMFISNDEVLIEYDEEKSNATSALFDADKDMLFVINHKEKKYLAFDKEAVQQMGEAISSQMQELQKQLDMLPEEQQAMVKKQMKGMSEELRYEKVSSDAPVNKWRTTQYAGKTEDGKVRIELFLADLAQLGLDGDDIEGAQQMVAFIREGMTEVDRLLGGSMQFNMFANELPIFTETIPVRLIYYNDEGEPVYTNTVTDVEEDMKIEEARLKVPDDYSQQDLPRF